MVSPSGGGGSEGSSSPGPTATAMTSAASNRSGRAAARQLILTLRMELTTPRLRPVPRYSGAPLWQPQITN
jgi:hypothetical protein